jgi:sugar fermentation stimulation protein A
MLGLLRPGQAARLSRQDRPSRKLRYTLELLRVGRSWVGVNPILANRLVAEAIADGTIAELGGYGSLRREVAFGRRGSRADLLLSDGPRGHCWIEVKSATLVEEGRASFPDAVTARGRKHLLELGDAAAAGERAVIFFLAQRPDVHAFAPADRIDPDYAEALREAARRGVEILAYRIGVGPRRIAVSSPLPVVLARPR